MIARADARGLGVQTKAFHDQMHPTKTLVVNCHSAMPLRVRTHWYPEATWVHGIPSRYDLEQFCDGLTSVYTAETAYNSEFWGIADAYGVKSVLHANYEFLHRSDHPTVWAAPSVWHIDDFPAGTVHLPVPIETDRFPETHKGSHARHFLHVVGRPAIHDRNGTADLLMALPHVKSTVTVTITCQQSGYVGKLMNDHSVRIPPHITLNVQATDTENYWDNYQGVDAVILPRRFGGLCLPANEAVGAGIPVIMPNIEPNSRWLPEDWRVPATVAGEFRAKQHIVYYRADPRALAAKIDQLASDEHFYGESLVAAQKLRGELSWDTLKPVYQELFR